MSSLMVFREDSLSLNVGVNSIVTLITKSVVISHGGDILSGGQDHKQGRSGVPTCESKQTSPHDDLLKPFFL